VGGTAARKLALGDGDQTGKNPVDQMEGHDRVGGVLRLVIEKDQFGEREYYTGDQAEGAADMEQAVHASTFFPQRRHW